jgi:hypothetical protein
VPGFGATFLLKIGTPGRFDIDGIYIDQAPGCRSFTIMHSNRAAKRAYPYRRFIEELRARLTVLKPGILLSTEGVNDLLGQYFDSQQANNDWTT